MSSSEAQTLLKHWVEYTSILAGMLIPLGEAVINIASHQVPPFRHVTRVHPSSTIHAAPWYQHYKPARINVLFMRINENWVCIKRGFQGENTSNLQLKSWCSINYQNFSHLLSVLLCTTYILHNSLIIELSDGYIHVYDTGCYKTVFIYVPEWKVLLNKRRDLIFLFVIAEIFKKYTLFQF